MLAVLVSCCNSACELIEERDKRCLQTKFPRNQKPLKLDLARHLIPSFQIHQQEIRRKNKVFEIEVLSVH
jgi:hypothetical protein